MGYRNNTSALPSVISVCRNIKNIHTVVPGYIFPCYNEHKVMVITFDAYSVQQILTGMPKVYENGKQNTH